MVKAKVIIFADAHDVFFAADPEAILEKFRNGWGGARIVWNAERNCFPNQELAVHFDKRMNVATSTPYRYLNSGLSIGETVAYRECLHEMGADNYRDDHRDQHGQWVHRNDQLDWQERFLFGQCPGQVPMALDTRCVMFQTMTGAEPGDFEVKEQGIYNRVTNTYPMAWHANGGSKTEGLLEPFLAALKL